MKTIAEYKVITSRREQNGSILIDEKAMAEGHTANKNIYSQSGFDSVWNDQQGNCVTSGYRLTKDGNQVLITVVNSYRRDNKNSEQVVKFINMD